MPRRLWSRSGLARHTGRALAGNFIKMEPRAWGHFGLGRLVLLRQPLERGHPGLAGRSCAGCAAHGVYSLLASWRLSACAEVVALTHSLPPTYVSLPHREREKKRRRKSVIERVTQTDLARFRLGTRTRLVPSVDDQTGATVACSAYSERRPGREGKNIRRSDNHHHLLLTQVDHVAVHLPPAP